MNRPSSAGTLGEAAVAAWERVRSVSARRGFRMVHPALTAGFRNFGPRSLANRILLLQFAWTLFSYVLVITALWFATNLVIKSGVRDRGDDWIAKFDQMGMPIYAANNAARLRQAIGYLRSFPEIARVRYLDETGKNVIAEYTRTGLSVHDFPPLTDDAIKKLGRTDVGQKTLLYETGRNSLMRISAPIWIKSIANDGMIDFSMDNASRERIKTIGFIDVVLDYSTTVQSLNRNIFGASMIIAITMLGAVLLMRIMVRRALKPLAELEEPLTRLANGETNVTVTATGDKEIARIGVALNTTIGALKARDETLRQMAVRDALTGLANRAYFVERLDQEVKRVARGGSSAALFFFDLDRFKKINDTYGHSAGDRLLIQVTKQLSQRIRDNDLFARYGGDEFTLLAYDVDRQRAREIAESFLTLMRDFSFYESGDVIKIYFSIGVTLIDDGALSTQDYLNEADAAAHDAKTHGRNCFRLFEREVQHVGEDTGVGWHEHLQEILVARKTILYYQPLIRLKGKRESNVYEVLLRLPDKDNKVIGPEVFLPAAERFGLMPNFDREMIRKAAKVLEDKKNKEKVFSLKVSEHFFAGDGIQVLEDAIVHGQHIEPDRLILELPQDYVVRNIEILDPIVTTLTQRGYRFAIDDFGAGFGSFGYIRNFPASFLKIDGLLTERLTTDKISQASVAAIVEVAAALKMETVAKYVSDEESIVLLHKLGVDYAQANHVAPPSAELRKATLEA